ncbi:hypothetical protein [Vibrio parahaemolyticus]|uniref:hypothetical protein n=1 Tax=Vibrio parahaemolyticus TaxID=670 RepID=UPI00084BAB0A|nr:hypothetical protein [Vibrio parahaemolyticus]ODY53762.1 hypothetical protein BBM26_17430 [Vibrio parahaemolyticus]ODY57936.1 hypothetical protein BBM96_08645 [Vibrio parahaemolyticus]ODY69696.1 hypothetical protein BBM97_01375 [Vibrio parahaemolyticus]
MKLAYYVNDNAQDNGDHEVHNAGCSHLDKIQSKSYLGLFDNCSDAVVEAKKCITNQMVAIGVLTNVTLVN